MNILEKLGIGNDAGQITEKIKEFIDKEDLGTVKQLADNLDANTLTGILNKLEPTISKVLYALLPDDMAKNIIDKLEPGVKNEIDKIDTTYLEDIRKKAGNSNIVDDVVDNVKDAIGGLFKQVGICGLFCEFFLYKIENNAVAGWHCKVIPVPNRAKKKSLISCLSTGRVPPKHLHNQKLSLRRMSSKYPRKLIIYLRAFSR